MKYPAIFHRIIAATFLPFLLSSLIPHCAAAAGDEWLPVTPEELQLKDIPESPGAKAIYLFREIDTDDVLGFEQHYHRIKILAEEGRSYANVEIPFFKGFVDIHDLKARTISPDGRISEFTGQVFERMLAKRRREKIAAKTFALPDVQVGSIIEYKFRLTWDREYVFSTPWIIPEELFTRRVRLSRRPFRFLALSWVGANLTTKLDLHPGKDGIIRLEMQNVPAFVEEEFMPPSSDLKARVDFVYRRFYRENTEAYWKEFSKDVSDGMEKFLGGRKEIERAANEIALPSDAPEVKLQKIYSRVQQLRNISFETGKTDKERKQENKKPPEHVDDILKRGFGSRGQINWLFLALVRAAGLEAWPLLVSRRDENTFNPDLKDPSSLHDNAVLVHLGFQQLFMDPGTPYAPPGVLPWPKTGVQALRVDAQTGSIIKIPFPDSLESRIEREAALHLDESGNLDGNLSVTYTGQEALYRRLEGRAEDDLGRKAYLESEVKQWIPNASDASVELKNAPDWALGTLPLRAEFTVKISHWANVSGTRFFLSGGIFSGPWHDVFRAKDRVHPLSFNFPFQDASDISISIPSGMKVDGVPPRRARDLMFLSFEISTASEGGTIHIHRRIKLNQTNLPVSVYAGVQALFDALRAGDDEILRVSLSASGDTKSELTGRARMSSETARTMSHLAADDVSTAACFRSRQRRTIVSRRQNRGEWSSQGQQHPT